MKLIKKYLGELVAILSGMIFILMASSWTSPLFRGAYGYDSAFFSMMGRAILVGKVPYRDYFDIKGPAFFFLEAVGQLLHKDRMGIFLLQLIAISFVTFYLYRICKLFLLKWGHIVLIFFAFYFIYFTCLWGGNSVEEFCLPLNMVCLYYGLLYLQRSQKEKFEKEKIEKEEIEKKETTEEIPVFPGMGFFFGVTFSICAFSKITVCAPMVAVTLVVMIHMLVKKEYRRLLQCAFTFVAGALMITIPIFVYFYCHNAMEDFLLCAFQIAGKRSTDYYEGFSLKWEALLIICYAGFLAFFVKRKEKGYEKWMVLSLSVITFVALHFGTPFDYYFITTLPLTVYLCVLFWRDYSDSSNMKKVLVMQAGILLTLFLYGDNTFGKMKENVEIVFQNSEMQYYDDCKDLMALIPESEQDQVYCLESGMIIYEVNQLLPANKYPVNLPYFIELYPPIKKEILQKIKQETPKWLVAENMGKFEDDDIKLAVYNNYELISSNSMDQLYRRIDK